MKEYALYKKEEILAMGTLEEIAEELGIKRDSVAFYKTPTYIKRTTENARRLVKIKG